MLKLLSKVRNSWKSVIIIIIFLIIQAMTELSLPDYTSKIINIGIQQNGIENCIPMVIRQSSMENIFLATDEKDYILNNNTLVCIDGYSFNLKDDKELEKTVEKISNSFEWK